MGRRCLCGDKRRAHQHWRIPEHPYPLECSLCRDCLRFRWRWLHLRAWRRAGLARSLPSPVGCTGERW